MGILSLILFLPLTLLIPALMPSDKRPDLMRNWFLGVTLMQLLCILIFVLPEWYRTDAVHLLHAEILNWIRIPMGSVLQIQYALGVDSLNAPMILLTALVYPLAALSSFSIHKHQTTYYLLMGLLNITLYGCFMAQDFFLFFLFFEAMLLPMYFLIGRWGGPGRAYAAIKFFIYTLSGSVFVLVVMAACMFTYFDPIETAMAAGIPVGMENASFAHYLRVMMEQGNIAPDAIVHTFRFPGFEWRDAEGLAINRIPGSILDLGNEVMGMNTRWLAFIFLLIGFAVKLPSVPFHTWLPNAHVEAPTPVSVLLAAVLLKIGGYGLIRIGFGFFPDVAAGLGMAMAVLGVVSIIYAALVALAQSDLKKMIAYSSISHMGYVMLGLGAMNATGMNGAILQMFNHGLISAMLFLIAGVLYDRTHDRNIASYQGLWNRMPVFTTFVLIAFFASMGLPGLSAFVSEFLTLAGGFHSEVIPAWLVFIAATGMILTAAYYLRTFQRMFMGTWQNSGGEAWDALLKDLTPREWVLMLVPALGIVLLGIKPDLLTSAFAAEIARWIEPVAYFIP